MSSPAEAVHAIDVRGLNKHFGDKHVVNDLSLRVKRGEIFGFLGPNGSGKTTSIRMMCGLLTPDSGSGTCLGFDIRRESSQIKRRVGYMTQRFSFWEDLSIRENLDFIARVYEMRSRREAVERAIEELRLGARATQLAGALSGGWQRLPRRVVSTSRSCCSSTSPPPASIRARAANSGRNCMRSPRAASRCW
jgi:ABC-2 type transport system ATP-binding protein